MSKFKKGDTVSLTWEAAHGCPTYAGMPGTVNYKSDLLTPANLPVYHIKWEDGSDTFVAENFLEAIEITNHTAQCHEYWDRGLDCQCIPEGVKQAIRDGASPEEVM